MKTLLPSLLLMSLAVVTLAEDTPSVDSITTLPIEQLRVIESNGDILFMSENGRFVFQGRLTDVWHKTQLDTMDEIRYAAEHINIDVMGLPLDRMNTLTLGDGPERIIVFVDPRCPYCKQFIEEEARNHTDAYTFKFVVVPALGDESHALARALFCAADKSDALTRYLDGTLGDMRQQAACDTEDYDLMLMVAQLFGIEQVPFFMSPDGRQRAGAGPDFWDWIEEG